MGCIIMLKKILEKVKPKNLDTWTPLHELYDTFRGKGQTVIISILVTFTVSTFCSGFLYQYILMVFKKIQSIYLLSCFEYGIKTWWLTLLLIFIILYAEFKFYRAWRRNYRKNFKENYLRSDKATYGSAHFQDEIEQRQNCVVVKKINDTDKEVLGINEYGNIVAFDYPAGLNHNEVYFGAPGSGKSAAKIKTSMYQAFKRGDSVVATDSKGDLYKETAAVAKEMEYRVRVVNFKPKEFKNSDGFNPMAMLKADDPELDAKANVIANIIIRNTEAAEGMDYWAKNEFNLLKCVIMYKATDAASVRANQNNLPEVFKFISSHGSRDTQGIFTNYKKDHPIRIAYDIFSNCKEDNQGQIINGLAIRLSILTNPFLQQVLSHDEIDLTLPMRRKCIYYVVISDTDDTYRFCSALFFNYIFMEQCEYSDSLDPEQKKLQLPVLYLLDEYRNIGGIQRLPISIATVRSRKMYITIILQDIGQLSTVHEETEATTILNCCSIKGLLSTNDLTTAKYFSDLLGSFTALVENEKYLESTENIVHLRGTIQKTMGEGERPLMRPEDLMNDKMSRDEIIYVISGMAPLRLYKYFSEKMGEAIHPLEKRGRDLGFKMPNRHKPKWRKMIEDAEAALQQQQAVSNAAPAADTSNTGYSPAPTTTNTASQRYAPQPKPANKPNPNTGYTAEPKKSNSVKQNTPSQGYAPEPKKKAVENAGYKAEKPVVTPVYEMEKNINPYAAETKKTISDGVKQSTAVVSSDLPFGAPDEDFAEEKTPTSNKSEYTPLFSDESKKTEMQETPKPDKKDKDLRASVL